MTYAGILDNDRAVIVNTRTRSRVRRVGPSKGAKLVASNAWLVLVVHNGGKTTLYRIDTGQRLGRIAAQGVLNVDLSDNAATLTFENGKWEVVDLRRLRKRIDPAVRRTDFQAKLQKLLEN